jgi:hypothetical protein
MLREAAPNSLPLGPIFTAAPRKPHQRSSRALPAHHDCRFVSRGDKPAIELFVAGIRGWEAAIRREFSEA